MNSKRIIGNCKSDRKISTMFEKWEEISEFALTGTMAGSLILHFRMVFLVAFPAQTVKDILLVGVSN